MKRKVLVTFLVVCLSLSAFLPVYAEEVTDSSTTESSTLSSDLSVSQESSSVSSTSDSSDISNSSESISSSDASSISSSDISADASSGSSSSSSASSSSESIYTLTFLWGDTETYTVTLTSADFGPYGSATAVVPVPTILDGEFGGWVDQEGKTLYTYVSGGKYNISIYSKCDMTITMNIVNSDYFIDEAAGGVKVYSSDLVLATADSDIIGMYTEGTTK